MKRILTIVWLAVAAGLSAASDDVVFGDVKVSLKMQTAPAMEFRTKSNSFGANPQSVNRDWAVVIVNFTPGVGKAGHGGKALRGGWIDGVTLDVALEIPMDGGGRNKEATGLLTGQTTFWSIPLDGKVHTAVMCVPPRILDRYLPLRGGSEAKASPSTFKVQVVFRANDTVVGTGFCNVDGKEREQEAYFSALAGGTTVKDAVLPRNKTPWAFYEYEKYDLIKE